MLQLIFQMFLKCLPNVWVPNIYQTFLQNFVVKLNDEQSMLLSPITLLI